MIYYMLPRRLRFIGQTVGRGWWVARYSRETGEQLLMAGFSFWSSLTSLYKYWRDDHKWQHHRGPGWIERFDDEDFKS